MRARLADFTAEVAALARAGTRTKNVADNVVIGDSSVSGPPASLKIDEQSGEDIIDEEEPVSLSIDATSGEEGSVVPKPTSDGDKGSRLNAPPIVPEEVVTADTEGDHSTSVGEGDEHLLATDGDQGGNMSGDVGSDYAVASAVPGVDAGGVTRVDSGSSVESPIEGVGEPDLAIRARGEAEALTGGEEGTNEGKGHGSGDSATGVGPKESRREQAEDRVGAGDGVIGEELEGDTER